MGSGLIIQFGVNIRRSSNPAFCSTLILDQDAQTFIQSGLQVLSRLFGLPVPLFDYPQEEKLSSDLWMESLLIQFMMLSLTLPPYTVTKAAVLSSWWPSHRHCEAAVRFPESQLFSKLNKPHSLSPSCRTVLQPHNHPMITGLLVQPNILGCTAESCLHCCPSLQQRCSPLSPFPELISMSFFLPRCRILPESLLNFMSPFLQPVRKAALPLID